MENYYTSYSKMVQNKTYYFVKKFLKFPEFNNVPDVLVGYGMHTEFEKACGIATIHDPRIMQKLLSDMDGTGNIEQSKVIDMHFGNFESKSNAR